MSSKQGCCQLCKSHKIGGKNYIGTPRSKRKPVFQLKYCSHCKVYFDTTEIRCFCCKYQLRPNPRQPYGGRKRNQKPKK